MYSRFGKPWWILICGLVLILLFTFRMGEMTPSIPRRLYSSMNSSFHRGRRVYLNAAGLGGEGLGSAMHHFKQSVIFAEALDSEFILANEYDSEFRYSLSKILNGPVFDNQFLDYDLRNSCRVNDFIKDHEREKLAHGICEGAEWASERLEELTSEMMACTNILDTFSHEITQDLNGCITPWFRSRLLPAPSPTHTLPLLTYPPQRPIRIGVHIRWGDTSKTFSSTSELLSHEFYGSFAMPNLITALNDLRELAGPAGIHVQVAMENAEQRVLDSLPLHTSELTVLDSRADDDLDDLRKLSESDVLLVGESSWAVMVHMLAPPGLTIVQDGGLGKYSNTTGFGRDVIFWKEYSIEKVSHGLFK
ncbi:unnamed protein product [Mycena citricolor]|uniref:Uncharacterized protein n=1 Tax=Mycena citricolor TaxID=2018698 RepID=A0AAD2GRN0_9AGAR|nr:unnamed protein product [Mycena citricolor]CAK5262421.1 unnamed protein product [Mycena citricolor]